MAAEGVAKLATMPESFTGARKVLPFPGTGTAVAQQAGGGACGAPFLLESS